ncbi:hypothetical protein, partial [Hymenobacter lapidarius]|uniref:hypothetical protein n=1 Tax=Hymenobacter lapidarius TaxID=1908237 RepID=UPI00195DD571
MPTSVVLFNGAPLATTVTSGTQLTATIPAALLALPSPTNSITVLNPTGLLSNTLNFAVTAAVCVAVSTPAVSVVNSTTLNVSILEGGGTTGPYTVTATPLLGAAVTVNATVSGTVAVPGLLPATTYLITVTGTCPAAAGGGPSPPSLGVSATTLAAPVLAIPIAVVVQPTCLVATGSLTVTAALSGGVYTLVGINATLTSTTGVFTNLAPGAYSLRVAVDGVVSAALAVTIDAAPAAPAAPAASVVAIVQPTGVLATGSLTVTSLLAG